MIDKTPDFTSDGGSVMKARHDSHLSAWQQLEGLTTEVFRRGEAAGDLIHGGGEQIGAIKRIVWHHLKTVKICSHGNQQFYP